MKNIITILLIFTLTLLGSEKNNYTIQEQDLNGKTITIENDNYKIFKFSKRITDIRLSKSDILSVIFLEDKKNPLSKIKIFAKKIGTANALITFSDKTTNLIYFNVTSDIRDIRLLINDINKDIKITQINDNVILKGKVKNNKIKNKILLLLKDALPNAKVIDLMTVEHPDKMVRLKLYVVEINNNEGETIKNNWSFTGYNKGSTSIDITSSMLNAVTLSGGITAVANNLGSSFNTGLTLNYLKTNDVANILDETTLITLENKASNFLAGGTLLIETSGVSADGQPITTISEVTYGLELNINVVEITNGKYVNLEIDTSSSTLDSANGVGSMPAKKEKSIKTNVIIEDQATIVLGGLISNTNSKDWEKIPFLGDIPIIGKLFQSKAFREGKSELIFFITPTIISTESNNQVSQYTKLKDRIIKTKKSTNEELHKQRVKDILDI
ncbi:MAG: hypothetical protein KAQ94_02165 [Arcobacteraceae bacterium]|nr:hypothetical protein [Arcobacteraceae bacterium]